MDADIDVASRERRGFQTSRRRSQLRWLRVGATAFTIAVGALLAAALSNALGLEMAVAVAGAITALMLYRFAVHVSSNYRSSPFALALDEVWVALWLAGVFGVLLTPLGLWLAPSDPGSACAAAYGLGLVPSVWAVTAGKSWPALTRRWVEVPSLPAELDGIRCAHVSDLHFGAFHSRAFAERWLQAVARENPELIVITGDLVVSGTELYGDVAALLGRLRAPLGVFAVLGNHDGANPGLFKELLGRVGVRVLDDEIACIGEGAPLVLAGMSEVASRDGDWSALDRCASLRPHVLLSHYPHCFGEAAHRRIPLVLSGHTHGGQVSLPWRARGWSSRRACGLYRLGGSRLYVSRGLGTTGLPVRLFARPEIVLMEFRRFSCGAASERISSAV